MHFFVNISNIVLSHMALATIMSMNFDFDDTFLCICRSRRHKSPICRHIFSATVQAAVL